MKNPALDLPAGKTYRCFACAHPMYRVGLCGFHCLSCKISITPRGIIIDSSSGADRIMGYATMFAVPLEECDK